MNRALETVRRAAFVIKPRPGARKSLQRDLRALEERLMALNLTKADVENIRAACDDLPIDRGAHPHEHECRDLADRIEAFLA